MISLIWAWINGWLNNREAGDLRRHRAPYAVTVMAPNSRQWSLKNSKYVYIMCIRQELMTFPQQTKAQHNSVHISWEILCMCYYRDFYIVKCSYLHHNKPFLSTTITTRGGGGGGGGVGGWGGGVGGVGGWGGGGGGGGYGRLELPGPEPTWCQLDPCDKRCFIIQIISNKKMHLKMASILCQLIGSEISMPCSAADAFNHIASEVIQGPIQCKIPRNPKMLIFINRVQYGKTVHIYWIGPQILQLYHHIRMIFFLFCYFSINFCSLYMTFSITSVIDKDSNIWHNTCSVNMMPNTISIEVKYDVNLNCGL